MRTPKIIAFAGSNRKNSFNVNALKFVILGARAAGADVTLLNLADYVLPLYDADWHTAHGVPAPLLALHPQLVAADALLVASPEYNASITPLLKNTIDWLSQSVNGAAGNSAFVNKPVGLIGASQGAMGGVRALPHVATIFSNLGAIVLPVIAVPHADKLGSADGEILNQRAADSLRALGTQVAKMASQLVS
jgi:chromate reductase, NAD(P)H dehydrogenase (quinone)